MKCVKCHKECELHPIEQICVGCYNDKIVKKNGARIALAKRDKFIKQSKEILGGVALMVIVLVIIFFGLAL